ncbi:MFS transporter [Kineosporia succinea]
MVVLRGASFRKLFSVRLVSQASDGAFQVGLASLVFFSTDRATTPTAVALAAVVTVVPYTLIGPFAGVLLDVWQRRQILLLANAIRSVMVLGVATMIFTIGVGPPVYLTALACLSMNRFFLAGLGASLPQVVPRHELVMANAVSPTCGTVATMLGGAVGFGLRTLLGAGDSTDAVVVGVAAVGYATASLLALRMPRTLLGPERSAPLNLRSLGSVARDVLRDLRAGAEHVRSRRTVANALGVIGLHRIGYGIMTITVMLLCRNYFSDPDNPDAGVALLARTVAALGLGVAVAAFLTPIVATRIGSWRWIGICLGIAAVVQAGFVTDAGIWLLWFGSFVFGLTGQSIKICVDSILQGDVDDSFRGRVFGFYDMVFNVALVSAAGLSVLLLPQDGYSPMVFMDVALVFAVAGIGYTFREHRQRQTLAEASSPAESPSPVGQNENGGPENRTPAAQRNLTD